MNWTCLVYGAPMTGALIWWVVSARKWFKGPKVNIEHYMLGREGNVIDAERTAPRVVAPARTALPRILWLLMKRGLQIWLKGNVLYISGLTSRASMPGRWAWDMNFMNGGCLVVTSYFWTIG